MCYTLVTYWIPKYKKEAIDWLVRTRKYDINVLTRMKKDKVFAIYHKIRRSL